ncbi:MAG: PIN domain-containing protein [Gemmatimonadota bacterium]|jgi:predicted nucleic acid-binding protein
MSDDPVFVDTNVLVYLRDRRDPDRQRKAAEWIGHLWESRLGRLSAQVLHEYYVTVTAKLRPGLSRAEAQEDALALQAWSPLPLTVPLMEDAWDVQDRWSFSFWDSLIIAAARAQGCGVLLTEDLTHGQDLDGLRVMSPFQHAPPV